MPSPTEPPRLTPDGQPQEPRRTGDETDRSDEGLVEDPEIAGDTQGGGYANTDEALPDNDGLLREGDQRDHPLV